MQVNNAGVMKKSVKQNREKQKFNQTKAAPDLACEVRPGVYYKITK